MLHKPGDKKLLVDFQELCEMIKSVTPVDRNESAGDKRKRLAGLLASPVEFAYYYYPEYVYSPFSANHERTMLEVFEQPNNIFLEQMFRGFGKSVVFGLIMPTFLKFNGQLNGMMLGSLNNELACERMADVQANLMSNQRIINDFGEQYSYGNWADGAFKTKDDCGFYAFGKEQSPRGSRFKWKRPNYGLIDDLNHARQLKNPVIAGEDKRWVLEEFKPALWTRRWWLVVAQNKFHDNTVTALIEDDEEIECILNRINLLDETGKTAWPQNEDFSQEAVEALQKSEAGGFIRERMNTPFEEGTTFKAEWMNEWIEPMPLMKYDSVCHYLDPSYKSTEKSDYKFWVLLAKTGKYYDVIDAWGEKTTSKKMWEHAYDVDAEHEDYSIIQHCMEANFIQEEVHGKELDKVADDKGRQLRCKYDYRAKGDKHDRVATLDSLFERGLVRFNIHKKNSPGMKLLRSQFLAFEKGSRVNDDGPDAFEGAVWMCDKGGKRRASGTRGGKYKKSKTRSI